VRNNQPIIIYLLTFLALSFILKFFDVINVTITELTAYAMIFYGINLVYTSFGKNRRGVLFGGAFLFLLGLVIFLINNFDFANTNEIIFPSLLFIMGICFFMLFFDDTSKKNPLYISLTFILTGIIVTVIAGTLSFSSFSEMVIIILSRYWPVIIIVIGVILLIHRYEKKKEY
jgi:hypothetical protein